VRRRLEFLSELSLAQRTRGLQRALADREDSLTDALPPVRWTELSPGHVLTGRVAGAIHDPPLDRAHLLVEGTDGLLHVIRQTPAIERRRGAGGPRTGSAVTLSAPGLEEGARPASVLGVRDHGRLEDLRHFLEPTTILDRQAIRAVRSPSPHAAVGSCHFSRGRGATLRERAGLPLRAGLLKENERARAFATA
jgi:hypothetical protein